MSLIIKTFCAFLRLIFFSILFCLKVILGFVLIFLDLNVLAVEWLTSMRQPTSDRVALACTLAQGALFFTTLALSSQGGLMMMFSSLFENLQNITLSRARIVEYQIQISVEFNLYLLCRALCCIIYHLLIVTLLLISNILLCVASFPVSLLFLSVGLLIILSQM